MFDGVTPSYHTNFRVIRKGRGGFYNLLNMLGIISCRVVDKPVEKRVNKVCSGSVNVAVIHDRAWEVAEADE